MLALPADTLTRRGSQSGQITCYEMRTDHVLSTAWRSTPCAGPADLIAWPQSDRSVSLEVHMKKGEATRQRIVAQTAGLLNTQGYRSTPVSEIMRVTGLQKGGIYRHFDSRATLTVEAFEYAVARMRGRLLRALEGRKTATDALLALFAVFGDASRDEA